MQWHLYCRVVDNFGDIGIAWRLAADLAGRGESVRLAVDDASVLAWLAPGGAAGVTVAGWHDDALPAPDVVVELFGGGIPDGALANAVGGAPLPVCVNLEHLSAESYVERSHRLPSPRRPARGPPFTAWFFYPGFTAATGGLLREPSLLERRRAWVSGVDWLAPLGVDARPNERRVSLFCYRNDALAPLLDALAATPTLLLLTPGPATEQVAAELGPTLKQGALRAVPLPFLSQAEFDRLLWSCDLNLVRGEDSLVRALWAGAPFVWQLYPQDDGAHGAKLEVFLECFLAGAPPELDAALRSLFRRWNGTAAGPIGLPAAGTALHAQWAEHCGHWRDSLAGHADLVTQLLGFVATKR